MYKTTDRFWRKGRYTSSAAERERAFWSQAKEVESGCWEWQGARYEAGYGAFWIDGRTRQASRVAWYFTTGAWPTMFVCHKCNNPPCINPAHLVLGSPKDNSEYMVACGRAATGLRNARYTHPETTARGERSGSTKHPELYQGAKNGFAKLSPTLVQHIRSLFDMGIYTQESIARHFSLCQNHVSKIGLRQLWRSVPEL
jgi:HNH endonuclease